LRAYCQTRLLQTGDNITLIFSPTNYKVFFSFIRFIIFLISLFTMFAKAFHVVPFGLGAAAAAIQGRATVSNVGLYAYASSSSYVLDTCETTLLFQFSERLCI
jgi:hypothetical protein